MEEEDNNGNVAPLAAYIALAAAVTTAIIVSYVEAPFFLGVFILVLGIAVIPVFILLFMRKKEEGDGYDL